MTSDQWPAESAGESALAESETRSARTKAIRFIITILCVVESIQRIEDLPGRSVIPSIRSQPKYCTIAPAQMIRKAADTWQMVFLSLATLVCGSSQALREWTPSMDYELTAAGSALVGAFIGATGPIVGNLIHDWSRDRRRAKMLSMAVASELRAIVHILAARGYLTSIRQAEAEARMGQLSAGFKVRIRRDYLPVISAALN